MCADSVVERRALREQVFPAFRQHCRHALGLDVRVSETAHILLTQVTRCVRVMVEVVGGAALFNILTELGEDAGLMEETNNEEPECVL